MTQLLVSLDPKSILQQLSSPIPSVSNLTCLLLEPLASLNLLSSSVKRKYLGSSSQFDPIDVKSSWIADIQMIILEKILVDWRDQLKIEEKNKSKGKGKGKEKAKEEMEEDEDTLLQVILRGWFFPGAQERFSTMNNALESSSKKESVRILAAQVSLSGLRVCSSLLSRANRLSNDTNDLILSSKSNNFHPVTSKYLLQILESFQTEAPLILLLDGVLNERNPAKRKLEWEDTLKNLINLTDKVANFTKGDPSVNLEREFYLSNLSNQIEYVLHQTSSQSKMKGREERIRSLASLMSKMIRTGFLSSIPLPSSINTSSFWHSILKSLVPRIDFQSSKEGFCTLEYRSTWTSLLSRISPSERSQFGKSLILFLDTHSLLPNGNKSLIASTEIGKVGREGTAFLSSESKEKVELVAEILDVFFSRRSRIGSQNSDEGDETGDSESDSDGSSGKENLAETLLEVLVPHEKEVGVIGSHLLARSVSLWAAKQVHIADFEEKALLERFFERIVKSWSDATRIRTASIVQEEYLTTLLLSSLCHLKSKETSKQALSRISHQPNFLNGVASHLDHLDPRIRRLGMLIAEIMSSVTSTSTSPDGKVKTLDFGKTLWDGVGQGKEEARVLRAFVNGWKLHDQINPTGKRDWTPVRVRSLLGIEITKKEVSRENEGETDIISSNEVKENNQSIQIRSKKKTSSPKSKRLPERVPPPAKTSNPSSLPSLFPLQHNQPQRKPLITSLSDSEEETNLMKDNGQSSDSDSSLQAYEVASSDTSGSSSYEDTSDSDGGDDEALANQMGSALGLDVEGMKKAREAAGAANGKDEGSSLDPGVPKKKRKLPPVYVAELIPLLKANGREENRLALRNAESLIQRKAGWGGEVDENTVELSYALCGLGDNWQIKDFEKRRTGALTALIVASPRIATGAVIEQYFNHQYSNAQRFAILDSLASASRDLAGLSPLFQEPSNSTIQSVTASSLAESLAGEAMKRARKDGEGHVPSIAREKSLTVNSRLQSTSSPSVSRLSKNGFSSSVRPKERYIDLSGPIFIFPLIQRFWSHLQELSSRSSRMDSSASRSYFGAGTGSLFSPMMISRFLDSLSVMVDSSRNSLDFLAVISPEILELVLRTSRDAISVSLKNLKSSNGEEEMGHGGDVVSTINSSLAGLALVALDASWEMERSKTLRRDRIELVGKIGSWAAEVFEREEKKGEGGGGKRVARTSAALVLRVAEIRGEWRENMLGY